MPAEQEEINARRQVNRRKRVHHGEKFPVARQIKAELRLTPVYDVSEALSEGE